MSSLTAFAAFRKDKKMAKRMIACADRAIAVNATKAISSVSLFQTGIGL